MGQENQKATLENMGARKLINEHWSDQIDLLEKQKYEATKLYFENKVANKVYSKKRLAKYAEVSDNIE